MEKVLNQQEIDEMVRAARAGNASAGATGPVVQPWDIRQAGQIGSEQLRAINQLHENFCPQPHHRHWRISAHRFRLQPGFRRASHLSRVPAAHSGKNLPIASCDLAPVGATPCSSSISPSPFPIIDIMLGGEGTHSAAARDLTEIEEQVLEGIVRIMLRELQNSWNAIALEFNFGARQHILQTQRLMPPEEKNLCLSFEIKMSETRGTLNLAVPAVVSNALLRKISADFSYQRRRSPAEARLQIQKKLLHCFFPSNSPCPACKCPWRNSPQPRARPVASLFPKRLRAGRSGRGGCAARFR
jgi:flagellar motor switch protein FliM